MRTCDAHLNLTVQGQWPDRHKWETPHPLMIDKPRLRRELRQQRETLSNRELRQASDRVMRRLAGLHLFRRASRIGYYLAKGGEIDLMPQLYSEALRGSQCFLPVLHPFHKSRLWFVQWRPGQRLITNRYGISEPVGHHARIVKPYALDVVLVPLLGFDERGNRLGMGKGYYDRCFGYLRHRRHWRKPRLIGIAHDFQKIDDLQPDPWDVPLDMVVTDCAVYGPFKKNR